MDYLGSADYLTSPVSGKVEAWTHYNEWGLIVHNAVLKCGQRELDLVKRYATHDYDSVLELYYAKARFYDAHDRRFTAVDPILDPSGYDLREYVSNPVQLVQYLYVENNPIIYIDPSGESIAAAVGTVVVYAGKAFAVGLVAWLFTPSGKEAIDNASMLMADGIVYIGNEIPAFAYRVTSGVIGFVGQLIIETPSSFEPKEMLTGVVNGAKIAETVGYMAKVACEGKGESDSNTQSGKSDSESNSNRKQPSTSNSLGTPKGDGGNGAPPTNPNYSSKDETGSYDETWRAGLEVYEKFNIKDAYVKQKHVSTSKHSIA